MPPYWASGSGGRYGCASAQSRQAGRGRSSLNRKKQCSDETLRNGHDRQYRNVLWDNRYRPCRSRYRIRRGTAHHGIYGGKDYNAWIGKIACERLDNGVDADAGKSAKFVLLQLEKDSTTKQVWQFLGAALRTYCPEKLPILDAAAARQ